MQPFRISPAAFDARLGGWLTDGGGSIRLGPTTCEVVVSSASIDGLAAVNRMDAAQRGCGPVIDTGAWLYWLVPPGTLSRWPVQPYGLCLGGGVALHLPPRARARRPGTFWLRPPREYFVDPGLLWRALMWCQPMPSPHDSELLARWTDR